MFTDQINSTSLTRDDTGVNKIQRYTPWGETRTNGGLVTDHTYTGQVEDETTGLRFHNARYQDPVIGRFVSADDRVPAAGSGQFYNRYTCNLNNPIKFTDSTGHEPEYAQNCYSSPATCSPPAVAVTADELALSTQGDSGGSIGGFFLGIANEVVDAALPGDNCIAIGSGCRSLSDEFKESHPQASANIRNLSAGYLQGASFGLAEDSLLIGEDYDAESGWFAGGELTGTLATLPLGYTRAGGAAVSLGTFGSAAVDCRQDRGSYDCKAGIAVAATAQAGNVIRFAGGLRGTVPASASSANTVAGAVQRGLARQTGVGFALAETVEAVGSTMLAVSLAGDGYTNQRGGIQ